MSIIRFRPQIWSANLLVALRKALVYGDIVNHDYEGEIAQAGDTVRITSIGRPTIADYLANSTEITPEELTDAQRTLVVDQSKYFAFKVDDVDARQAKGDVIPTAMSEAAYGLADVMDQYIAGLYTGAATGNQLGGVTLSAKGDAYEKLLVPLKVALDEANVPTEGRFVVVSSAIHGKLLLDDRFVKVNESGTTEGLRNGFVGRGAGFDVRMSNNTPTDSSNPVVVAGNRGGISFAQQISKTEAYRPESSFSDAVKGLALYGAKVVRPDNLATAVVTVS